MRRLYYNDDDFGQQFRDALGDYREVPPRGNWKKINARLDKRVIRRYTGWISGIAAMLAVVILGASINISTKNARLHNEALKQQSAKLQLENNNRVPPTQTHSSPTNPISNNVVISKSKATTTNISNDLVGEASTLNLTTRTQALQSNVEEALTIVNTAFDRAANENIDRVASLEVNEVETIDAADLLLMLTNEEEFVTGSDFNLSNEACYDFYVGIALQPQHNLFLSQSAIHDQRMLYKFSPGYAFGVTAGYNVLSKLSVETGGMWSVENQNYEFAKAQSKKPTLSTTTSNANQTKVGLNYVRVPLMLKYKMRWSGYSPTCASSINVLGGVQYGRFFGGQSEAQKEYKLTEEEIKKNDLQVMLGAERSQPIAKNLTLNYGLRFGYGLSQMGAGQSQRINTIYKPHNMLAAVNVSLNLHK